MLEVTTEAEAPLFIGAALETGNVIPGLPIIPGSVLRGALAAAWIRDHGPPQPGDPEFTATFDGAVRYGPLTSSGVVLERMSLRRCKHRDERCTGTFVDRLHDTSGGDGRCQGCGGPTEPGKGEWLAAHQETHTRVALTADNETAEPGQLFSREAIPSGTCLVGTITNPSPWLESLTELTVWVGGRRTVAGRTRLIFRPVPDPVPPVRPGGAELALVLHSPGVFVDDFGLPRLEFPTEEIARRLDLPANSLTLVKQWARVQRVAGWHAASGLPKPEDLALAPGSAGLFDMAQPASPDQLARLARDGLGLRRSEGMGWVAVNPPRWEPPSPAMAPEDRQPRPEVAAFWEITRDSDSHDRHRLYAWLSDALCEAAELAEAGQSTDPDRVINRRRELHEGGLDLRAAARALFVANPTPRGLRETADQLEGAR